jgi:hypothetical protein
MDLGMEEATMTAEEMSDLALAGEVKLLVTPDLITNSQIDMMVPSWEKNKVFSTGNTAAKGAGNKAKFRKRREWDDADDGAGSADGSGYEGPPEDAEETRLKGAYTKVRSSLNEALGELSEKDGLTDDELQQQMFKLRNTTENLK